jgi:hypothetical protein
MELRRLWRAGVMVVVASGNEGRVAIDTPDGEFDMYAQMSIGDPANLEECVAVGSVNADQPHLYGVSSFSSRGPTADGRGKPDVIAPGPWPGGVRVPAFSAARVSALTSARLGAEACAKAPWANTARAAVATTVRTFFIFMENSCSGLGYGHFMKSPHSKVRRGRDLTMKTRQRANG